jgi:hypothetical protein
MISSITKKATAIYLRISSLLLFLFFNQSFAAEDLASFCFEKNVSLKEVEESLTFLLLPREHVFPRPKDLCLDVNTSTDRSKLLEKFLSKRYTLIPEGEISPLKEASELQKEQCAIEFTTAKQKEVRTAHIGVTESRTTKETSVAKLLLGFGTPGTLDLEGRSLTIECRKGAKGDYQLIFSSNESTKSKVSSEVSVKQNEVVQVGQIIRDLNEKNKALGIPYKEVEGEDKITYELKVN